VVSGVKTRFCAVSGPKAQRGSPRTYGNIDCQKPESLRNSRGGEHLTVLGSGIRTRVGPPKGNKGRHGEVGGRKRTTRKKRIGHDIKRGKQATVGE